VNCGALPRTALAAGKAFAAGVKAVPQTAITVLITAALGGAMNWNLLRLLGVVVATAVLLGSALFSCPPMAIAGIALTRDRLMGIGQATGPLIAAPPHGPHGTGSLAGTAVQAVAVVTDITRPN
jgi:ABC-2 type transport system permease protein